MTGLPLASWTDNVGTGVYTAGVDSMQVSHESAPTSVAGTAGTDTVTLQSTSGTQTETTSTSSGGLNSSTTVNGMTRTNVQSLPSGPGDYTDTTTNPDGTKTVDTYVNGLLDEEQQIGTDNSVTSHTDYDYDDMGDLESQTDSTGITQYTYWADGTVKTTTDPAGNVTTNNNPDAEAGTEKTITRAGQHAVLPDIR